MDSNNFIELVSMPRRKALEVIESKRKFADGLVGYAWKDADPKYTTMLINQSYKEYVEADEMEYILTRLKRSNETK